MFVGIFLVNNVYWYYRTMTPKEKRTLGAKHWRFFPSKLKKKHPFTQRRFTQGAPLLIRLTTFQVAREQRLTSVGLLVWRLTVCR